MNLPNPSAALPPSAVLEPKRRMELALAIPLAALGLFLPWSPAGVSLTLVVLVAVALFMAPALWRTAPWREPVMAVGLLLLAFIALHTLAVSGFSAAGWQVLNKYHELLVAPLLLAMFRLVSRKRIVYEGLVLGTLVYAMLHWIALVSEPLSLYLEMRRISTGFVLAVCAFLMAEDARSHRRPWLFRLGAAFLAVTVFAAVGGRTGHVVMLVLLGVQRLDPQPAPMAPLAMGGCRDRSAAGPGAGIGIAYRAEARR